MVKRKSSWSPWSMPDVRNVLLPERAEELERQIDLYDELLKRGQSEGQLQTKGRALTVDQQLASGGLFWVTHEMTKMAIDMCSDLPSFE